MTITGASRTAAGDAYDEACMSREMECGGFSGDSPCGAGFGSALVDALLEESSACLELPCAEIVDCLSGARPHACNG